MELYICLLKQFIMQITRTSSITGKTHTLDLPVTQEQMDRYTRREGHVQTIFPHLSPAQREFIMTGITDEEWKSMFG
jgi:hypothetical protein